MLNLNKYRLFRFLCGGEWFKYKVIRKKWFVSEFTVSYFWSRDNELEGQNNKRELIIVDREEYDSRFQG